MWQKHKRFQARRQQGTGGIAPPIFIFAPPIYFLPPTVFFLKVSITITSSRFRRPHIEI